MLTVGIEIPQEQNRRRKLTNKVLELSDIACCRGGNVYGTYGYSFMASNPKCNGLQASIDVQLLVRGCVFDKHTHTTMQRAISFDRRYTIVCIFFEGSCFVTMENSFLYAKGCGIILRYQ